MNEVTEYQQREQKTLTAVDIRAQVNLIQEVMRGVMKKDEHYGTIPGTKKPSLYKPGAEKLLVTFRIAALDPKVEDLSVPGESIRYRVTRGGQAINSGAFVGAGVGECSSDEEKYKWRKPVCDAEFDETPEDRRQVVWKNSANGPYQIKRVRTNPADVANTILKMADKRAYVALALQTTAASDIFTQDIEDLPAEIAAGLEGEATPARAPIAAPVARAASAGGARVITDPQRKRFYAIWKGAGKDPEAVKAYLREQIGSEDSASIPADKYEALCAWAEAK